MALIDNLEAMLARGPDNALLRFGLGSEYLKLGRADAAVPHLRQALAFKPDHSAAWKLLGQALAQAGDAPGAAAAYTRGIAVAEKNGDVQAAKEMRVFLKRLAKPLKSS